MCGGRGLGGAAGWEAYNLASTSRRCLSENRLLPMGRVLGKVRKIKSLSTKNWSRLLGSLHAREFALSVNIISTEFRF